MAAFSTWATSALRAGDTVEAMAPMGRFTHELDPLAARTYTLVAGGSGITPIYSIAATILDAEPDSIVTLLQVDQATSTIMLLDDIEDLRNRHLDRFRVWRQLTREPQALGLLDGRPSVESFLAGVERGLFPAAPDHVFLCGPEALIETITDAHTCLGLQPEQIHTERFTSRRSGEHPAGFAARSTIRSNRSPPARSRSTAAPAPSPCCPTTRPHCDPTIPSRGALCVSGRRVFDLPARVTEGEVEMATTYGLVPGEADAGFILTCQATPASGTVSVDFDV